ncbi:hypothetical protein VHEMI10449 [[Torrubiella] hemipterigena]|uniref:Uncharacterized protein n=1 Tax=[Torrubiella] hemipterigena TaxID=1531966 RepID=A0A0A1TRV5_9HYPO|nr:hypothetical protein VHEMI10449 [[Torrubiella] hemipterigena]
MSSQFINIPKSRPSSSTSFSSSPKTGSYSSWSSACSTTSTSCASSPSSAAKSQRRRPSLLSTSFTKEEATVINIGEPEGPPRLISYLSSSQGFDWNPEIFLPSYLDCDYTPLENRREPVHEIRLTDEEMQEMLPH